MKLILSGLILGLLSILLNFLVMLIPTGIIHVILSHNDIEILDFWSLFCILVGLRILIILSTESNTGK